jgi:carbamoyltransferase
MSFIARAKQGAEDRIPAVLHVDQTARLQTVTRESNSELYTLLHTFYQRTGLPMLLNTSLNVAGQPIACDPHDALDVALKARLDELFLGPYCITLPNASRSERRIERLTNDMVANH